MKKAALHLLMVAIALVLAVGLEVVLKIDCTSPVSMRLIWTAYGMVLMGILVWRVFEK